MNAANLPLLVTNFVEMTKDPTSVTVEMNMSSMKQRHYVKVSLLLLCSAAWNMVL